MSPDSEHGGEGAGLNRGCEIVHTELRPHTDGTGRKETVGKVTGKKVSSRVDRWRLLIGLSITLSLRSGVVKAGLVRVYK